MDKYIYIIGNFKVTKMDAAFQLIMGNSYILKELGYKVIIVGNDNNLACKNVINSHKIIDGFDVYNIKFNKSIIDFILTLKNHKKIMRVIKKYPKPSAIVSYCSPAFAVELKLLHIYCKRNSIPYINNCADLPATGHGTLIQKIFKTIDNKLKIYYIKKYSDGIIGVSTYINNYYSKYNKCPKIIIPPLKNYKNDFIIDAEKKKIQLVYIGEPFPIDGRKVDESSYKDRLDLFIDSLCKINFDNKIEFNIYGLTKKQYLDVVNRHVKLLDDNDFIHFNGRVSHDKIINELKKSDFSVLFRIKDEMTMAGFSSKLVESICLGVPMILTNTSDYSYYLEEGKHCFFIDERGNQETIDKLNMIKNISKEKIKSMKRNCLYYKGFNYLSYLNELSVFLDKLNNK